MSNHPIPDPNPGGRPVSVTLLALGHILAGGCLAGAPFLTTAGHTVRRYPRSDAAVLGYEIPTILIAVLCLGFLLVGFGLMWRARDWARQAAIAWALLCLGLGAVGGGASIAGGLTEGSPLLAIFETGMRTGLIACACGLVIVVLRSEPVREWFGVRTAEEAASGEAVQGEAVAGDPIPEAPVGSHKRVFFSGGIGLILGLAIGGVALYYVISFLIRLFLEVLAGLAGGNAH